MALAWTVGNSVRAPRREHAEAICGPGAAGQAVTAERLRIARELHDMVAHSIGVIAIQAGVGRRVIDTQPAEARNALRAIEATSRETLAGLRRMLGALRQRPAAGRRAPLRPAPGLDRPRPAGRGDRRRRGAGRRWSGAATGGRCPPTSTCPPTGSCRRRVTNVVRHAGDADGAG